QHQADIIVARDRGHAEQGLAIRSAMSLLQRALMGQKGRAAHEKHRERGETDIGHGVFAVTARAGAPVGQAGADIGQFGDQGLQGGHRAIESKTESRRQAKSSRALAQNAEFRGVLQFRLALAGLAASWGWVSGGGGRIRYATHSHLEPLHPRLSGCHPHPLHVGYEVEAGWRMTGRTLTFWSAMSCRFHARFPSFSGYSPTTLRVPPTWRRRGGTMGSSAPIAKRLG